MPMTSHGQVLPPEGWPRGLGLGLEPARLAVLSARLTRPDDSAFTRISGAGFRMPVARIIRLSPFLTADTLVPPSRLMYPAPSGSDDIASMGSDSSALSWVAPTSPVSSRLTPVPTFVEFCLFSSARAAVLVEPQLTEHRTLAVIVTERNSLNGPGKPVGRTARTRILFFEFIDLFVKFLILLLHGKQQNRHVLVHLLEGVVDFLLRAGLAHLAVQDPAENGSEDGTEPREYLEYRFHCV